MGQNPEPINIMEFEKTLKPVRHRLHSNHSGYFSPKSLKISISTNMAISLYSRCPVIHGFPAGEKSDLLTLNYCDSSGSSTAAFFSDSSYTSGSSRGRFSSSASRSSLFLSLSSAACFNPCFGHFYEILEVLARLVRGGLWVTVTRSSAALAAETLYGNREMEEVVLPPETRIPISSMSSLKRNEDPVVNAVCYAEERKRDLYNEVQLLLAIYI